MADDDLKSKLLKRGMKLMQDPRFMKVMQDERVLKTIMGAMQLRGKVQENLDERVERIAKKLNLATKQEIKDLRRTIRRMERELEEAKAEEDAED